MIDVEFGRMVNNEARRFRIVKERHPKTGAVVELLSDSKGREITIVDFGKHLSPQLMPGLVEVTSKKA